MPKEPLKTRRRDNNGKSAVGKDAREIFADAFTTDRGKGRVTRAAKKAYPNQSHKSAGVTGSRLLKDPRVAAMVEKRLQRAAKAANITREQAIGMVAEMGTSSLFDVLDATGESDLKAARAKGVDHLIKEFQVVERTSKDGSKRRTVTYKVNDRLSAIDLLAELRGWKKEPAKNPLTAAQESYAVMRAKPDYADIPDQELAKLQAEIFGVSIAEILSK